MLGHPTVTHPDQLVAGPARVRQRAEKIERRGDAELATSRDYVTHGGVVAGGETETDPDLFDALATDAGGRAISTPSASRTSADPVREEAARPPCLHTGTPAPATIRAAIVETLIVPARSPPVPQVSTSLPGQLIGDGDRFGDLEHGLEHARKLLGRFALAPQPENEGRHLRWRRRPVQDLAERRRRLGGAQVLAGGEPAQKGGPAADVSQ